MTPHPHHTVAVGIDGGPASVAALEVALTEAEFRGAVVHAIVCWPARARTDDSATFQCDTYEGATALVAHTIDETLKGRASQVTIISEASQSLPGPTLVEASRSADLLILGSTTRGSTARHHGHHVIDHCLRFAESPVIIVPWNITEFEDAAIEAELQSSQF